MTDKLPILKFCEDVDFGATFLKEEATIFKEGEIIGRYNIETKEFTGNANESIKVLIESVLITIINKQAKE